MIITKTIRRYGAEIIAFHFCSDIADVREMVYQPTRYSNPNVYSNGRFYYCCPTDRQKLPAPDNFHETNQWERVGEYYGRKVYRIQAIGD